MAYAAVISLKRTIDRHINPTNPQITKYAYHRLNYIGKFFERVNARNCRNINKRAINAFDAKIREAVCKLEDVIESYVLHRSLPPSESLGDDGRLQIPPVDEESVEQEIDSFLKTVKKLEEKYNREVVNPEIGREEEVAAVSPVDDVGGKKSTTVGLSDQFEKIRRRLLDWGHGLKIVSLVGMAGIGKTHLARNIYQDPITVRNFDCKAWVRAGPKAQTQNILADIVAQIECKPRNFYTGKGERLLAALLKKVLRGRRYLIVLDDVWSTSEHAKLIGCLPDVRDRSRVLLTTRLEEVARSYSIVDFHRMRFMNNEESWELLWQNVFGGESSFPPQLEKAGRKIAEKCEGLPLLILAVADLLRGGGVDHTEDYWNKVADKKTTTFRDANNEISKVLLTSYDYLPQHLKACFLYLGVFPHSDECEIPRSKLINLWITEDFFEPSQHGNLQDFCVECLEELVSNSVVIVCKKSSDNRTKSFKLHCAYWHLCVREARKNKFFLVLNKSADASKYYLPSQRRLSVQNNVLFGVKQVRDLMAATITVRSLLCTGEDHEYPVPICFNLIFLKVLDALALRFYEFPMEAMKLLQLRYLALTHNGEVPSSISNLQQLQCLILRQHHNIKLLTTHSTCLPMEIWNIQELTHLRITGSNLPNPSRRAKLPNLVKLHVNARSCTKAVFRSIPNLRKLGLKIELRPDTAETLSCFKNIMTLGGLESFTCEVVNLWLRSQAVAPPNHLSNLPRCLKKVSLNGLGYSWTYMSLIGSLPSLRVLKLRCCAFRGAEWEIKVGQFVSLEFLLLQDMDLMHWTIYGDKCFPNLRHLIIGHCYKLKRIPQKIAFIRTLKKIEVVDCSPSVVASAKKLRYSANTCLQVLISSSWNL